METRPWFRTVPLTVAGAAQVPPDSASRAGTTAGSPASRLTARPERPREHQRKHIRRFPGEIHHFRGAYGRAAALLVACVARHTALLAHLGGPLAAHPVCTTTIINLFRKSPKSSRTAFPVFPHLLVLTKKYPRRGSPLAFGGKVSLYGVLCRIQRKSREKSALLNKPTGRTKSGLPVCSHLCSENHLDTAVFFSSLLAVCPLCGFGTRKRPSSYFLMPVQTG